MHRRKTRQRKKKGFKPVVVHVELVSFFHSLCWRTFHQCTFRKEQKGLVFEWRAAHVFLHHICGKIVREVHFRRVTARVQSRAREHKCAFSFHKQFYHIRSGVDFMVSVKKICRMNCSLHMHIAHRSPHTHLIIWSLRNQKQMMINLITEKRKKKIRGNVLGWRRRQRYIHKNRFCIRTFFGRWTNRFYCRFVRQTKGINFDTFIVCQKIYLRPSRTEFVFPSLFWHGALDKQSRLQWNAQNIQQNRQQDEEDSIIDDFLTLFHKLCAFKCLTRKINNVSRLATIDVCLRKCYVCTKRSRDGCAGTRNGLFLPVWCWPTTVNNNNIV